MDQLINEGSIVYRTGYIELRDEPLALATPPGRYGNSAHLATPIRDTHLTIHLVAHVFQYGTRRSDIGSVEAAETFSTVGGGAAPDGRGNETGTALILGDARHVDRPSFLDRSVRRKRRCKRLPGILNGGKWLTILFDALD